MPDQRSKEAFEWRKLYRTKRWRHLRNSFLIDHPFCSRCEKEERAERAVVVHHKDAHKGNIDRFFDWENLEALCEEHHNSEGQMEDIYGYSNRVGVDGFPVDPKHPANVKYGGSKS